MLTLVEINEENFLDYRELSVGEDQRDYLDSAVGILARGYAYRADRARVIGIAADGRAVGIALVKDLDEEPACYDLQQFMIDRRYQGQGFGTEALRRILEELETERKYGCVEVCVKREDTAALRLYEKLGFTDTGYVDESVPDCMNLMYCFPPAKEKGSGLEIRLGKRTPETVRIYFDRAQNPKIKAVLPQKAQTAEEALRDYEESLRPGASSYGRTILADGVYIGDVWCYGLDPEEDPNAMLSFCIFEERCWNRGIATEAVGLFLQEICGKFGLRTLGAFCYSDNTASIRVLEKLGFCMEEEFLEDGRMSRYYQYGPGEAAGGNACSCR